MTKTELAKQVASNTGLNQNDCLSMVDQIFNTMRDVLLEGHEIKINGFGSFVFQCYQERLVKVPKGDGKEVRAPRARFVRFNASRKLRVETPIKNEL